MNTRITSNEKNQIDHLRNKEERINILHNEHTECSTQLDQGTERGLGILIFNEKGTHSEQRNSTYYFLTVISVRFPRRWTRRKELTPRGGNEKGSRNSMERELEKA